MYFWSTIIEITSQLHVGGFLQRSPVVHWANKECPKTIDIKEEAVKTDKTIQNKGR